MLYNVTLADENDVEKLKHTPLMVAFEMLDDNYEMVVLQ